MDGPLYRMLVVEASLRSLPCRYAQGFLFGRAAAADDADHLVLGQTPPRWAGAEGAYRTC